jgi:hypothetical protein
MCGQLHQTRWEIKCDCGGTIYVPFAEETHAP